MLDHRDAPSSPATASALNFAWLRITGKDNWVPTTATIYSCDYTDLPNQINSEVGHYHVTYTYEVGGELYTGHFVDFGRQDENYFKRNDTLMVRYNPHDAGHSYYPALRTRTNFRLICAAIGAALGLLAIVWYAIAQHKPD